MNLLPSNLYLDQIKAILFFCVAFLCVCFSFVLGESFFWLGVCLVCGQLLNFSSCFFSLFFL
ncbi:hypothetical protein C5167_010535 [Papaver somniferum]|uniref:Uncharacterized protein n=1 Tax=Papaver somniferum TaxID=3469 RepID=A0A4Y7K3C5_PAPSO|nr:hypothetical protein C5167_010535 [Papaver somniferum]